MNITVKNKFASAVCQTFGAELLSYQTASGKEYITTFRKFGQFAEETRIILAKHRVLYPGYDEEYPDLAALLARRAAFQEAVALWREGHGAEARRLLRPHADSAKVRLFLAASFLPGSAFDTLARLYFRLPGRLRK